MNHIKFRFLGLQVSVTNFNSNSANVKRRDYEQEAVDYFRTKLEQYGNAEVPIKSLLGHRCAKTALDELSHS